MKQFFLFGLLVTATSLNSFSQSVANPAEPVAGKQMPVWAVQPPADEALTPSAAPQQKGYVRPDALTRRSRYLKSIFGPTALAGMTAGAAINTWTNSPREWGTHWDGFGKRVASSFGKRVIGNSVLYGLDEAMGVDSHFYRSEKRDIGSRARNAFASTFTARRADGKRVPGLPRILAAYTSNVIAVEAWYPSRYTYKDGLKNGSISLGLDVVYNLITEFIRKK